MESAHIYEIRVEGRLADHWSDWFSGLKIRNETDNETALVGMIPDQAALLGILASIHSLNLVLVSVNRVATRKPE